MLMSSSRSRSPIGGGSHRAAEGDLADPLREFRDLAFVDDLELSVPYGDLGAARAEISHEDDFLGVLTDIDEAPAAGDAVAEAARIDIADLADHVPVRVLRGQRHREVFENQRLVLHRDVAVRVGSRPADEQ